MLESALRTAHAAIFTLGLIAVNSPAQAPSPCGVTATGVMVYESGHNDTRPFSLTLQTTHEQKFVDGNVIHGTVITHQYRDSAGRTHGETSLGCSIGADGQLSPMFNVSVNDPATRTSISWRVNDPGEKMARAYHQPDPPPATAATTPTPEQRQRNVTAQTRWRKNTRGENLGTRIIASVLCDGSRQITTIPAGEQGNDQPIEMSTEVWIAHDSGIAMLRIDDDPRSGRTTTEVTELSRNEPDPSLFTPPPGYKLVEQVTRAITTAGAQ